MINRWKRCKNEIGRRQTEIKEAFDRLGRFKKNLDKHVSFLDKTEVEFNQIASTEAETSDAIQRKIDSIEEIKKDLDAKQHDFETVRFSIYMIVFEPKISIFDTEFETKFVKFSFRLNKMVVI